VEFKELLPEQVQVHVDPSNRQLILALIVNWLNHLAAAPRPKFLYVIDNPSDVFHLTLQLQFLAVHLSFILIRLKTLDNLVSQHQYDFVDYRVVEKEKAYESFAVRVELAVFFVSGLQLGFG